MEKERNWTFIVYPESVTKDWKEYLQQTGLKVAISPLHDKDINPDGEKKKAHYHVLLIFEGPTTYNRVERITKVVKGTIPQRVISPAGMIRYFSHKDNPEKAWYDERDIETLNGLDIEDICSLTQNQENEIINAVLQIIKIENIMQFYDLINYLKDNDLRDMQKLAIKYTFFFKAYLQSKKYIDIENKQ